MLAEAVIGGILACLSTGPDFAAFGTMAPRYGFEVADQRGADVRWQHSEGHQAFVQSIEGARICSVWTNGGPSLRQDLVRFLDEQTSQISNGTVDQSTGRGGPEWDFGGGEIVRFVEQRGNPRTIGAAFFVYDNQ